MSVFQSPVLYCSLLPRMTYFSILLTGRPLDLRWQAYHYVYLKRSTAFNIFIWYFGTYPACFGITVLIKMVICWGGLVLLMKQNNLMNSYCGFAGIKIVTLTLQHLWVFVEILIPTCNIHCNLCQLIWVDRWMCIPQDKYIVYQFYLKLIALPCRVWHHSPHQYHHLIFLA